MMMINCVIVLLIASSAEAMYNASNPGQSSQSSASIFSLTSLTASEMNRIMEDDWPSDFTRTNIGIRDLEFFIAGIAHGMKSSTQASGSLFGNATEQQQFWANSQGAPSILSNINKVALGGVNFDNLRQSWGRLRSTLEKILTVAHAWGHEGKAIKCKQFGWVREVKRTAEYQPIYTDLIEIFFEELYIHCYKRNMAVLKLKEVEVPKSVQQLVNIYLGMSPQWAIDGFLGASPLMYCEKLERKSLDFHLQRSLVKYGTLEQVAKQLILFNPKSQQIAHPTAIVSKFRHDCINHVVNTQLIIASLDKLVVSMERHHLAKLYARNKAGTPMLVYATICRELTMAPN